MPGFDVNMQNFSNT